MISSKLKYNPLSGWFKTDGVRQGKVIHGWRYVHYEGKILPEWQAAWKWMEKGPVADGKTAERLVIHLNGDVTDNRERNLALSDKKADYRSDLSTIVKRPRIMEELVQFLVYDKKDGSLRYSEHSGSEGEDAWKMSDDRKVVFWCGVWYAMEDIVWLMVTGMWPERGVVHLNGDFSDMRIENLRRVI